MRRALLLSSGSLALFLLTSLAACSTVKTAPNLPTPPPAPIVRTIWRFATPPPLPTTIPECPEWEANMTNEMLAAKFEDCRAAREVAQARVALWEEWAAGEAEAHRKGTE